MRSVFRLSKGRRPGSAASMTELMGVKLPAVRLATLADALGKPLPAGHDDEAVAAIVDPADWSQVWLALAVLSGRLPDEAVVTRVAREAEFEPLGLAKAIVAQLLREMPCAPCVS
nr:hypothetical protein GCM10025699_03700 [Microbacterium flavescens]